MLSHQTLFNSYKVVPHAKQTKASSMLPGTSDISHDFIMPKPKQNNMEKPNELKTICKTTRGSWTLRLKFLLGGKKNF